MRIGVIGAGPSGLAALRALDRAGLEAVGFEKGSRIGGIWTLEDRLTAAYRSLHLITSRERTQFEEFPMPAGTPDYAARAQVGAYLEAYAEHFGLLEKIRLGTPVERAVPLDGGGWEVDGDRFDALVVASGHNDVPKWPDPPYPGDLSGEQLHAAQFGKGEDFAGKHVLVVGMGNSAMDIATDISYSAARTLLSVRRGSWIVPKRLLGKPADQTIKPWVAVNVPWQIRQPISQLLLTMTVGRPEKLGFPPPARGLFQDHPTITDTVPSRIAHGKITPKGPIERFAGDHVRFADGSEEAVDAIVWCTGYRVDIPFLPAELVGPDPQALPLYKRVVHLERDDLLFVGLMQSTGSAFPIVERQAQLAARRLTGRWSPPGLAEMRAECEARRARSLKRWGPHGRPDMRVDFDLYMHELGQELAR
jgi:cation diffusion facilitator CzcD-associated flavoprotein CzcO